jgi:hypothetical protein
MRCSWSEHERWRALGALILMLGGYMELEGRESTDSTRCCPRIRHFRRERRFSLGRVLTNRNCSAIAGCRERHVRHAERSGDFLTPSPPDEKATARQEQTRQSRTDDGAGNLVDGDVGDGDIVIYRDRRPGVLKFKASKRSRSYSSAA